LNEFKENRHLLTLINTLKNTLLSRPKKVLLKTFHARKMRSKLHKQKLSFIAIKAASLVFFLNGSCRIHGLGN
ncbi:TPA: hypothetical protein ACNOH3_002511, partial [Enterobacter hormaechei]